MAAGSPLPRVDLVVLAGGRGERLGGRDKAALVVAGRTLLDRLLAADLGGRVVVVGETPVPDGVMRVVEDPPGGGPAAGIGAGLDALSGMPSPGAPGAPGDAPTWVAVAAVDQPGAAAALAALRRALPTGPSDPDADTPLGPDALSHVDDEGRRQWLLAIYRRSALEAARDRLARGRPEGERHTSVRSLVADLRWREVESGREHMGDIDTWADLERWRSGPTDR